MGLNNNVFCKLVTHGFVFLFLIVNVTNSNKIRISSCQIVEFTIKSSLNESCINDLISRQLVGIDYFHKLFTEFDERRQLTGNDYVLVMKVNECMNDKFKKMHNCIDNVKRVNRKLRKIKFVELVKVECELPKRKSRSHRNWSSVKRKREYYHQPNDPKWSNMWYINPRFEQARRMGIYDVWRMGYTGKGITITIVDDGVELINKDLRDNYIASGSVDIVDNDYDPSPRYDSLDINRHGTRCAGVIAAKASNNFCGVGVAYNARIGGIRIIDGLVTDGDEARALSFAPHIVDIYSSSWGPRDDGDSVDGPGRLTSESIKLGIRYGRHGKGSIYVWASGNGGSEYDHCSCDGYVNSIYTITVGSITQKGNLPYYVERCPAVLTSTYSSGNSSHGERSIVSTDIRERCTMEHTGTSASAPMVSGIISLALQANKNLDWRIIQHLLVESSNPPDDCLKLVNHLWIKNARGRYVSDAFGFGLIDARKMVALALKWNSHKLPLRKHCSLKGLLIGNYSRQNLSVINKSKRFKLCSEKCTITYLEHVQLAVTVGIGQKYRGYLKINLISPSGTKVVLLDYRLKDKSLKGFNQWPFMSVMTWGEDPRGCWIIEFFVKWNYSLTVEYLNLVLHGMVVDSNWSV
ncbi:hypothetical protein GJ496_009479 [Pomphorhynchus laevis]|nr:hypothetical protein GJ496_009479 [Pomphorhynchus laevis]